MAEANKNTDWIRKQILDWYAEFAKPWPWRKEPVDQYVVLVSEFMLQQTQASHVSEKLKSFLILFPTLEDLASAGSNEVISAWKGLGYNSRALRLRNAARTILDEHAGMVPKDPTLLKLIPGIGDYTSASLPSFIYNMPTLVVDVNILRVYSRLLQPQEFTSSTLPKRKVVDFGLSLIPAGNSSTWYSAVMDFGSAVCNARQPQCPSCVLNTHCASANTMQPKPRTKAPEKHHFGLPNRLWRGKIVELLRGFPDAWTTTDHLLGTLLASQTICDTHQTWFQGILFKLQKNHLIDLKGNQVRLHDDSRPSGGPVGETR